MFKTSVILALSAFASAQFLGRDLQSSANVNVSTAFATSCSASATGTTDSCTANYCCGSLRRAGTSVSSAAAVCVPLWFSGVSFNVSNVNNTWTCIN